MRRALAVLLAAWGVGAAARWVYAREANRTVPAGFGAGFLHGAAMPCALPALVAGADPIIYTPCNTGRSYKLGYALGVNACGAAFFGLLYRRRRKPEVTGPSGGASISESNSN